MKIDRVLLATLLLTLGFSLSCAAETQNQRVTKALQAALRSKISSPGGQVNIVVKPSPRAAAGYFSEIRVYAKPAQIKKLRFASLHLTARNVRLNTAKLLKNQEIETLQSQTQLRANITEGDLTRLLAQGRSTASMGLQVKFLKDRIRVAGRWNWTWFRGPVVGVGKLQVAPGHKVNFNILSLKLNGREVPAALKNKFSDRINPVLDYRDLPFRPQFRGIRFKGSTATVLAH